MATFLQFVQLYAASQVGCLQLRELNTTSFPLSGINISSRGFPVKKIAQVLWNRAVYQIAVTKPLSAEGKDTSYSPLQIPVYLSNPLKTPYFQGFSLALCSNLMYFPCFCPYEPKQGKVFYSPPTTLSSNLAEVRSAFLVA